MKNKDTQPNNDSQSNPNELWRGTDEALQTSEFQKKLKFYRREASFAPEGVDRRTFLKIMGASLALAGLTGCRYHPQTKIVPYVKEPEGMVPGVPKIYATSMPSNGYAKGALVTAHEAKPTKIEGNPDHPATLGASDAQMQSEILRLYDPDRSQSPSFGGRQSTWEQFFTELKIALDAEKPKQGAGVRILTETVTSYTLFSLIQQFIKAYPQAKWHQYQPINRDNEREGAKMAFGFDVQPVYRFERATRVLALDADFLNQGAGAIRYAGDFCGMRSIEGEKSPLNRLYVVEPSPTLTGTVADHRLALHPDLFPSFISILANKLNAADMTIATIKLTEILEFIDAVAEDLLSNRSAAVVVVGANQPPLIHAFGFLINAALGTDAVTYINPVELSPVTQSDSIIELVDDLRENKVTTLLTLGGNVCHTVSSALELNGRFANVFSAHLSYYDDETSMACRWHLPEAHWLESWGDVRAYDGTASVTQPLIEPLYPAKSAIEVIGTALGLPGTAYDWVKQAILPVIARSQNNPMMNPAILDEIWQISIHDGLVKHSAEKPISVTPKPNNMVYVSSNHGERELSLIFRPDYKIFDGRYANNAWLQELPDPLTKIVWDNPILISAKDAELLGLKDGDVVTLNGRGENVSKLLPDYRQIQFKLPNDKVNGPVYIMPGQAEGVATLILGYGRTKAGNVGNKVGYNAYPLMTNLFKVTPPVSYMIKSGEKHPLITTQQHHRMEGRDILRRGTLEEFRRKHYPHEPEGHHEGEGESLYPGWDYPDNKWGLVIDLTKCIGCGACAVACQAENNIMVVGKEQVGKGREMNWIRVDRYFEGDVNNPEVHHMPLTCMQCELAPCEPVCPVGATVHDHEGLNDMVYNRCIGTRYCSNNCPYKVRRFNFFEYPDHKTAITKMQHNPNVTIRTRGVMEKCTYCVQRINAARITAKKADREIRDGEIQTACMQACPARAITFGNLNDSKAEVTKKASLPNNYMLLNELGTKPRTTYLGQIRNPNPKLKPEIINGENASSGTH